MRGLTGRRVVICGGATGVGAATAERLGAEGVSVTVGDLNIEGARATANRVIAAGGTAVAVEFDLADDDATQALFDRAVAAYGGVDGLVNLGPDLSLGTLGPDDDLSTVDLAVWRRTLEVNLLGYTRTCRLAIPLLLARGGGAIVNVSSRAALYAAAKAGVNTLTRHVAAQWGREGIRCNSVAPGQVFSETTLGNTAEEFKAVALAKTSSTRLGRPADVAAVAAFLLSDDTEWVNGQTWSVNGGASRTD